MSAKAAPSVDAFLAGLANDRRETMTALHAAIVNAAPKLKPYVSGSFLGYGKYLYRSPSGSSGESFLIGLASGKSSYALHIVAGDAGGYLVERHAANLGKVNLGRSCIKFKKLEDLNLGEAMKLVKLAEESGGFNAVK